MNLNRAMIIGNLTRDPEMRSTPSGKSVASFGVATNRVWTDSNGQKQEQVEYHNIVAWGRLAEICGQYLGKGRKVYVEGRLQTREWQGQDGARRTRTEIVADNMIMLDRAPASGGTPRTNLSGTPPLEEVISQEVPANQPPLNPANQGYEEEIKVEDLPF